MIDYLFPFFVVVICAFLGVGFLASAVLVVYRDVLGRDDKFSLWLDRGFGTGYGLGKRSVVSNPYLNKLIHVVIAVLIVLTGCALIWFGVVEPIAVYFFGFDIA